jgi:parallel beta-helix repeat protein
MKRCWIFCLFIFAFSFAKAQNFDVSLVSSLMPGRVEGRGKYFEIKNSPYLNITLESSEEIEIILESIPKSINLRIEPSLKNSTILTLRGLEPKKVYYKYQDTYKNGTQIVSDEKGSVSWVQDLTEKHYIWIQEEKGTFIFPKDCPNWDETNSVCTLDEDIQETIEISGSDFTLDCNFKKIKGNSTHGIYIAGKNNVTIKNCDIQGFSFCIYSASSTGIRIENSSFTNLLYSKIFSGIFLINSSSSTIENNNFYDISHGIRVEDSSHNVIAKNNIFSSNNFGIFLYRSSFNFVNQNRFLKSGLFVFDSYQNVVEENTVNEKPLIYLEGKENMEIKGAGQVIIVNSKNIKVEGESISNVSVGVEFFQVKDSEIANNQFTGNLYDVFLYSSNNNRIIKNLFSSSPTGSGIYFSSSTDNEIKENIFSGKGVGLSLDDSSGNFIEKNVFSNNVWYGILFVNSPFPSANNVITKNTISGNYHGIRFDLNQSISNLIYLNNFLNNTSSIHYNFTPYFPNNWNSIDKIAYSYQGKIFNNYLGNYWQDYQGKDEDGDGIGDSPHFITQSEKDAYPLISTFENYSEISFATSSISINYFPKEPVKGTKVVFSAVSSIPFTKFEWQIASSTFFGTTTEFTFNENGEYQITLTATDNDGTTFSTSTTLKVEPFSFAIITDVHIGRHYQEEYEGQEYYLTQRLKNVINWINQNKDKIQCGENVTCPLKFLVILGDITENTSLIGFCKVKEILDQLQIPYVPVFGNHDVGTDQEYARFSRWKGQDYFDQVFWSKNSISCQNATSTKNFELLLNELNFQRDEMNKDYKNFSLSFSGINFIGLDFVSREPFMKFGKGVGADAALTETTKKWLEKKLEEFKGEPVILLAHHPLIFDPINSFSMSTFSKIKAIILNNSVLFDFGGHIHSFYDPINPLGLLPQYENVNKNHHPIDSTQVLTTEALMVGSNGRGVSTSTKENGVVGDKKGIVRIVKIFDKDNIDPYNWETKETGDEFLAFNPSIKEIEYERICSPGKFCMEFESNFFTKKPFMGCWKVGNSNVGCGKEIILTSPDQTIQCSGSQEELKCSFSQVPLKTEVTLFAFSNATSFFEKISKKFEVKEGIFPKIIKAAKEKIGEFIFKSLTTSRNLLEKGRSFKDKVIGLVKHSPEIPVAIFEIDFEKAKEDIDFSGLIMDSDPVKKKAILYMENWPNEVERSKVLLIPKK